MRGAAAGERGTGGRINGSDGGDLRREEEMMDGRIEVKMEE